MARTVPGAGRRRTIFGQAMMFYVSHAFTWGMKDTLGCSSVAYPPDDNFLPSNQYGLRFCT